MSLRYVPSFHHQPHVPPTLRKKTRVQGQLGQRIVCIRSTSSGIARRVFVLSGQRKEDSTGNTTSPATSSEQPTPDTAQPTNGVEYDERLDNLPSLQDFLEQLETVSYEEGERLLKEFLWAEDWDPIGDMEEAERRFFAEVIAEQEENDPYND